MARHALSIQAPFSRPVARAGWKPTLWCRKSRGWKPLVRRRGDYPSGTFTVSRDITSSSPNAMKFTTTEVPP